MPDALPYKDGVFLLEIDIPEVYPFIPPRFQFITPIYNPMVVWNSNSTFYSLLLQQPLSPEKEKLYSQVGSITLR